MLDGNKTCEVLLHTISYYFRETELDIGECEEEHIAEMIGQGYNQGELNITDPENPEEVYYGWWKIEKN